MEPFKILKKVISNNVKHDLYLSGFICFVFCFIIVSYIIVSYIIVSYIIVSYVIVSYIIVSYIIVSYIIVSSIIVSYIIVSYESYLGWWGTDWWIPVSTEPFCASGKIQKIKYISKQGRT